VSAEHASVNQDASRADKLARIEQLADELAHEIKNPLHSMVINLEVLQLKLSKLGAPGQELLRFTTILGVEIDRLNRNVDLLLRATRSGSDPVQ
jgi:signal transduction histidine kinase